MLPAVLELPAGITTCLFDLDGVLTQTAYGADVVVQELIERVERHA
jgi:hypothetical protein